MPTPDRNPTPAAQGRAARLILVRPQALRMGPGMDIYVCIYN